MADERPCEEDVVRMWKSEDCALVVGESASSATTVYQQQQLYFSSTHQEDHHDTNYSISVPCCHGGGGGPTGCDKSLGFVASNATDAGCLVATIRLSTSLLHGQERQSDTSLSRTPTISCVFGSLGCQPSDGRLRVSSHFQKWRYDHWETNVEESFWNHGVNCSRTQMVYPCPRSHGSFLVRMGRSRQCETTSHVATRAFGPTNAL